MSTQSVRELEEKIAELKRRIPPHSVPPAILQKLEEELEKAGGEGRLMPKKVAAVDYQKCHPEKCDHGICLAALECEYANLVQEFPYEAPEINPAKWCHGCAKCAVACPLKAIRML